MFSKISKKRLSIIELNEKINRYKLTRIKNNNLYKLKKEFNFFFLNSLEKDFYLIRENIRNQEIFNFYLINKQIKILNNICKNLSLTSNIEFKEFVQRRKIQKYTTTYLCKIKKDFEMKLKFFS